MLEIKAGDSTFQVDIDSDEVLIDGKKMDATIKDLGNDEFRVLHNNKSYNIYVHKVDKDAKTMEVIVNNTPYEISIKDRYDLLLEKLGMDSAASSKIKEFKSPMPGLIVDVHIKAGDEVKKDDPLLILEAMKMENTVKAPGDGKVKKVYIKKGAVVEKGQLLIEFA